ncbi:MAG: alpha/beta fold hydrolase [Planctomycetota bacterium]|nr:alpha/beta fold hydrolase [Planctomycetota bacterium]
MATVDYTVTNLELRASSDSGEAAQALTHQSMEGLFLLHVKELAAAGEPRGGATLVHDAGDHGGRYLELARRLTRDGWAAALPDLRGHGESEGERGHGAGITEVSRDLAEVQNHLSYRLPNAPRVMLGQGLGALYGLAFAVENPGTLQALVLAAPLLRPEFDLPTAPGGLRGMFKKVGPRAPGSIGWTPQQWSADEDTRSALAADPLRHDIITLRAGQEAQRAAQQFPERLAQCEAAVLVMLGTEDPLVTSGDAERLVAAGAVLLLVEGGRHDLFHGPGAEEAGERVAAWFDEHGKF